MEAIKEFCQIHNIVPIKQGEKISAGVEQIQPAKRAPSKPMSLTSSMKESLDLFLQKRSLAEIAKLRGLTVTTILEHVAQGIRLGEAGPSIDISHLISPELHQSILKVIHEVGGELLRPFKDKLPPEITYDQIRLVYMANCLKRSA